MLAQIGEQLVDFFVAGYVAREYQITAEFPWLASATRS